SSAPQTPTPVQTPGLTTAHRRSRTTAGAPPRRRTIDQALRVRRGSGPAPAPRLIRMLSPAHRAGDPEGRPGDQAAAHTTDAAPRTEAPSPLPPPPRAAPAYPLTPRSRARAAPSFRSPRPPARPALRSVPRGRPRAAHRAPHA